MVVEASAPGKIILFGEHAVVYGRPAIAAPLSQVRARAIIRPGVVPGVLLQAPDLGMEKNLSTADLDDAFAVAIQQVQKAAGLKRLPAMHITVTSAIPIASGLGSGAAITAAIVRALAEFLDLADLASDASVSAITYEVEKIHHGTPSGIDNTVVTYEKPVYFVRQQPENRIETFKIARPLRLLIADTGMSSSTKEVVGDVRAAWQADRARFETIFDACGLLAEAARSAIERGDLAEIGRLMVRNQAELVAMTVSSAALDRLVTAATDAGALGAKLSGGGRGGNMIALVTEETGRIVRGALLEAGARQVIHTVIGNGEKAGSGH